ncbi:MAG TPA: hypothetical protein VLJ21_00865 [Candidatus Binatia bacterium]|nr:hypothetical protein [Candidatus Binatia bacterium]
MVFDSDWRYDSALKDLGRRQFRELYQAISRGEEITQHQEEVYAHLFNVFCRVYRVDMHAKIFGIIVDEPEYTLLDPSKV